MDHLKKMIVDELKNIAREYQGEESGNRMKPIKIHGDSYYSSTGLLEAYEKGVISRSEYHKSIREYNTRVRELTERQAVARGVAQLIFGLVADVEEKNSN